MSSNLCNYMDYRGGDHWTADHYCVWMFIIGQSLWAQALAYGLQAIRPLCLWRTAPLQQQFPLVVLCDCYAFYIFTILKLNWTEQTEHTEPPRSKVGRPVPASSPLHPAASNSRPKSSHSESPSKCHSSLDRKRGTQWRQTLGKASSCTPSKDPVRTAAN